MNKQEFLTTLDHYLASMPDSERLELLRDYESHFHFGLRSGKSETEIVAELGDPLSLAREAVGPDFIPPPPWVPKERDLARTIGVTIMLFFLNVMLVLPVGISVWAGFVSVCAVAFSGCVALPLLALQVSLYGDFHVSQMFAAIGMTGVGILLAYVIWHYAAKGLFKLTLGYVRWVSRTWKGRPY